MLEEWAWDADVLATFATDEAGTPIPAGLVARMRDGEEFGKGFLARTQSYYAAVSYVLHVERPDDLTARVNELAAASQLFGPIPVTPFHCAFGPPVSSSSAYFSHNSSRVLATSLFSAFVPVNLVDPQVTPLQPTL